MSNETSVSRKLLLEEVIKRGYKYDYMENADEKMIRVRANGKVSIFFGTRPSISSANGMIIAIRKSMTYEFIKASGYEPLPYILVEDDYAEVLVFLKKHKKIVVKPSNASQSAGVTANVTDNDSLEKALKFAFEHSPSVVLQKQVEGELYRLLFVGGKLFAASRLVAASITGDGKQTIEDLVKEENKSPYRGNSDLAPLKALNLELVSAAIAPLTLGDILEDGKMLYLSDIPSLSRGGETEDVTEMVHPAYADIFGAMIDELGQAVCAVELITEDIVKFHEGPLPVIEFNSSPGTRPHLYPTLGGIPRNPIPAILDLVFEDTPNTLQK